MSELDYRISLGRIAAMPCDYQNLGGCNFVAQTFGYAIPKCRTCIAADALGGKPAAEQTNALRSCQGKKRYKSPEAAGKAVEDRAQIQPGLRVYSCALCEGFHLTKGSLEDFAARRA